MIFGKELAGSMLMGLGLCLALPGVPEGLAAQPMRRADIAREVPSPRINSSRLEARLSDLNVLYLARYQAGLAQILDQPAQASSQVQIYYLSDRPERTPTRLSLTWDDQPLATVQYSGNREAGIGRGGAEKLISLQTSPGTHTLGLGYTIRTPAGDVNSEASRFDVRKEPGPLILLVRTPGNEQPSPLQIERMQWPAEQWKHRLLDLWVRYAVFLCQVGRYPEAVGLLRMGLEHPGLVTDHHEWQLWLGKAYFAWGLNQQAEAALAQLISSPDVRAPVLEEARLYAHKAAYRKGEYANVTAAYERVVRQFAPAVSPEMHYTAAQSFLHQKQYAKAIRAFSQIPRISPHFPYALYGTGLAYLGFGDAYAAQQSFQKLADLDPPDENAPVRILIEKSRMSLGFLFVEQARYREAIETLGRLAPNSRFFDRALFGIGWSYMKLEEYTKAIVAFQDLSAQYPRSRYTDEARLVMAYAYSKLKAYPRAVAHYRDALETSSREIKALTREMGLLEQAAPLRLSKLEEMVDENPARLAEVGDMTTRYRSLTAPYRSSQPAPMSQELMDGLKDVETGVSEAAREKALQILMKERERLEDLSIKAGIGIAKNLVLGQTEFGGEELVLE